MRLALLALILTPWPLSAQTDSTTRSGEIVIAPAAREHMLAAVQRDTVASFCAIDAQREGPNLTLYAVARAARVFAPNCGPYLPILARPRCFLHVREAVMARYLLICDEGKYLVERAR